MSLESPAAAAVKLLQLCSTLYDPTRLPHPWDSPGIWALTPPVSVPDSGPPDATASLWVQISQETGQVVWYSHLFQNFPQLIVIHTVKGFGIVNKAEIYAFWNYLAFSMIQRMLAI